MLAQNRKIFQFLVALASRLLPRFLIPVLFGTAKVEILSTLPKII
jgi:hypothetical protein